MDSRRTQILNDMGIEAWRLRSAAAAASQPRPNPNARAPAKARPAPRSGRGSAGEREGIVPSGKRPEAHRSPGTHERPADVSAGESFTVTAFCTAAEGGGALLACGRLSGRGQALLAADIVRCLCRNWTVTVRRIEFNWPLPGVPGAPEPALGAFLDKQVHDFAVTRALATTSAAAKLPAAGINFITIPDLAQFEDPDAKRALWSQLQESAPSKKQVPTP